MPLLKCADCHHEWEGTAESTCNWCQTEKTVIILEEITPLERTIDLILNGVPICGDAGGKVN